MKKILFVLFCIQSSIITAQIETAVSPNGKKVLVNLNPVRTADNGLNATGTTVQLGGNLTKSTSLNTNQENTLAVTGLQTGTTTDLVAVLDANDIVRNENQSYLKTEPWFVAGGSTQATLNTQNIYQMGNVGIGTTTPATKLHVKSDTPGAIKIQDGTQAAGSILTTDANGLASWKNIVMNSTMIKGIIYGGGSTFNFVGGGGNNVLSNYKITLPAGNWVIYLGMLINNRVNGNSNAVGRFGFSSNISSYDPSSGGTVTYPANSIIANYRSVGAAGGARIMFCSGSIIVKTTAASTTLYLWNVGSVGGTTGGVAVGGVTNSNENYLYAIKVTE